MRVIETNLEQVKDKLSTIRTNLTKAEYLESVFKKDISIDVKRFSLETLSEIYTEDRMYLKAAKALSNKARFDLTFKEKINSYVRAAELFSRAGSIEDAEEMFGRAAREANEVQKLDIVRNRKEIYFNSVSQLEKEGKRASVLKFYEHLLKMRLSPEEKTAVKEKLINTYKLLGRFKDAEILSNMN